MKKLLAISLLVFSFCCAKAQTLEWVNTMRAEKIGTAPAYSIPNDIAVDDENNSYVLGGFRDLGLGVKPKTSNTIVKYNEVGELCWYRNFENPLTLFALTAEENTCNIYSLFTVSGTVKIGDSTYTFKPLTTSLVLMKSDSALNPIWTRVLSDTVSPAFSAVDLENTQNHICTHFRTYANFIFKNKKYSTPYATFPNSNSNSVDVWLKLDKTTAGSSNEWITTAYSKNVSSNLFSRLKLDGVGNAYSVLDFADTGYYVNDTFYTYTGHSVLKLQAANGKIAKQYNFGDLTEMEAMAVTPTGKIFVSCVFDTAYTYQDKKFTSPWLRNTVCMFVDGQGKLIWAAQEENIVGGGFAHFKYAAYKNSNIYCSGAMNSGTSGFGGFPLVLNGNSDFNPVFGKFDTLGNCLWTFVDSKSSQTVAHSSGQDLKVDNNGNPIITAIFVNEVSFLDTTIVLSTLPERLTHGMVFKLSDYAIFRGDVYAGPYCAGDTIEIPYTKKGKFRLGNEFIAQLSDDNGDFFGGERELGRLKDTAAGVIKGVLPAFNVNTSGNYRIRIVATQPMVQSYYRQDTLRLLIYSRDSANAGNDTILCRGQSVQLTTTGGSKWEWSPAASLDNPAKFKPIATPVADTRYRIIISDSSGCGDTDTDYVWVRLRQPLNISPPFTDSIVCKNQLVKLYAIGTGGDSTNYTINWYEKFTDSSALVESNADSIAVVMGQTPRMFYAELTDNCTVKPDTQLYILSVFNNLKASFSVYPQRIEVNETVQFYNTSKNATYYQWNFGNDTFIYSNGDTTLSFTDSGYKTIQLVAENVQGCKDTAYTTIRVFEKLYCTIPNAFTPNHDGLNQTFAPVCVGLANYTLTVYNRWGQVIYQKENGAWDGTYADAPVPEGVYMYKIHLRAENKRKSLVYGTVNLIR